MLTFIVQQKEDFIFWRTQIWQERPVPHPQNYCFSFSQTGCLICQDQAAVLTSLTSLTNFTAFPGLLWDVKCLSPLQDWLLWVLSSPQSCREGFIPCPSTARTAPRTLWFISPHCLLWAQMSLYSWCQELEERISIFQNYEQSVFTLSCWFLHSWELKSYLYSCTIHAVTQTRIWCNFCLLHLIKFPIAVWDAGKIKITICSQCRISFFSVLPHPEAPGALSPDFWEHPWFLGASLHCSSLHCHSTPMKSCLSNPEFLPKQTLRNISPIWV